MSINQLWDRDDIIELSSRSISLFGLTTAVYISVVLSIIAKAEKKNKFIDNNFVKLDRKYIFNRTTISTEAQLDIDESLFRINLIKRNNMNPDIIYFDSSLYLSLLTNSDVEIDKDFQKKFKGKKSRVGKESKRQSIITSLKDYIQCSNYELLTALRDWVDAIFANPKGGYLSKTSIDAFVTTLNEFTKGDANLALRIVKIATIQGYKMCEWAIDVYKKDELNKKKLIKNQITSPLRVTEQKNISNEDDLSSTIF